MNIQKMKIEGMTCNGCVGGVTKALKAVPGVIEAKVSLSDGTAEVSTQGIVDPTLLTTAVSNKGYRASLIK